jgi:hypothetical protein
MHWSITPAADPDDPRWLDHERWHEVVVRAETAAMARRVAARHLAPHPPEVGNESEAGRTGFEDEKLYHVHPVEAGREDDDLAGPEIVSASRE